MYTLGLDIGGANLKASDGETTSASQSFPLWRQPEQLSHALREVVARFDRPERVALTMTGELADCFRTKTEGVNFILDAALSAFPETDRMVWQSGGEFVDIETARELIPLVAAANWHAQATWAGRMVPIGKALLVDMGSTTTDLIPIDNGFPMPQGRTDPERLATGELVYLGVRRTPLIGLLHEVRLSAGSVHPLANELFATTHDLFLVVGDLDDCPENCDTANGRPATREFAFDRLARQLCGDVTEFPLSALEIFARKCLQAMTTRIHFALRKLKVEPSETALILSGEGAFFARRILAQFDPAWRQSIDLTNVLGRDHSQAACAFALARLAREVA